jgi:hypothetical protein
LRSLLSLFSQMHHQSSPFPPMQQGLSAKSTSSFGSVQIQDRPTKESL